MRRHLTCRGFTLIELLIVIGLLGLLTGLLLTTWSADRTDTLDSSIVQKELHDIQRAFQRFQADCVPKESDYRLITRYGLEVLMWYDPAKDPDNPSHGPDTWSFSIEWDADRSKGWRGPYIEREDTRPVDLGGSPISTIGQPELEGGTLVPVICTPYVNDDDGIGHYYRVIPDENAATSGQVKQLWVVFPSHGGDLPANPEHKRRLILD